MAHLAEDAAVRACDALHGADGVVRVEADVRRRALPEVDVLRGDLAVCRELTDQRGVGEEAAFAVRDRHGVNALELRVLQPRGEIGADARVDDARLVAADGVVGQRRAVLVRVHDPAVGHEAELDERLEAVADAGHESAALVEEARDRVLHRAAAEEGRDELARAVRLVAAGEAARQEDDLRLVRRFHKALGRAGDVLAREVSHHEDLRLGAGLAEGAGGVIFAVRAGEDGDEHLRLRRLHDGRRLHAALIEERLQIGLALRDVAGIDALELRLIAEEGVVGDELASAANVGRSAHDAKRNRAGGGVGAGGQLHDERAVVPAEDRFEIDVLIEVEAHAAAEAHLEHGFGHAAVTRRPDRDGVLRTDHAVDGVEQLQQASGGRQAVFVDLRLQEHDLVARQGEHVRQHVHGAAGRHREGDERRRHVEILEAAGHGVLAADGRDAETQLRLERAEQGGEGLAPALRVGAEALEVFLKTEINVIEFRAGRDQLGAGFHDREIRAVVGALL